ncbi:MAG TPA: A/G-specific adenine glycosylase [Bacteroidia bacterium]|nr:A/G-specific adenine glycosylase [Bacteroidia bacterium]
MSEWSHKLLNWYNKNKRDLPWRNTADAYKIWLSEVILQQTRVNQGMNYYLAFTKKYPTVLKLAAASEHEVLKLWQGLGYYSRARNMHNAALHVKEHFKGKFPTDYESIRSLKGVGDYTAAAIASFAYNLPYPVIDGNVMRVYSRFLGITSPIDSTEGKKQLIEAANEFLVKKDPGTYNQAIMELGALVCTPKNPKCTECPLQAQCYAYSHKLTEKLPIKQGKTKQRERYLNYLVISSGNKIILRTRNEKDIWKGLHDFPCIETDRPITMQKLTSEKEWHSIFGKNKVSIQSVSVAYTHILSHQRLKAIFIKIDLKKPLLKLPKDCFWIKPENIDGYAIPRLIERYLSE